MSQLYIRVLTGFYTHKKTIRLKIKLGADAFWIPPRIWAYAAENQPDGDLSAYSSEELAELIGFASNARCNAQAMLQALKDSGFIEESGMIHDWHEHNGYHKSFSERAKKAAAARWSKEKPPTPPKEGKGNRKEDSGDKHCLSDAPSIPAVGGDGEHSAFIKGWTENFKAHFGFEYVFDGGRDGKAVKTLLATKILRIDLLEIAKQAWNHQHTFACKQASTIHGFNNSLNPIRTELKNGTINGKAKIVPDYTKGF